ncbi:MAG TPA: DUF6491 family protein [Allosphingosinicella sp.]|jgi:hypothetical protein
MMKKLTTMLLGAATLLVGLSAVGAPAAARGKAPVYGQPARIAWAAQGGIQDWHVEDDRSIYIRDRNGRWYLATFSAPCPSLRSEYRIGFETGPLGEFDDWGVIRTPFLRCHVETLVTSPAPAAKGGGRFSR